MFGVYAEPLVTTFMHVNLGLTLLGSFTNIETPIFLALLVPTGLLVYWSYYKNYMGVRNIGGGSNPIATMLNHAFFFDDIYYAVAKGIGKFSDGLKYVDDSANLCTKLLCRLVCASFFKAEKSAIHNGSKLYCCRNSWSHTNRGADNIDGRGVMK